MDWKQMELMELTEQDVLYRLERDARYLASHFGLPLSRLMKESDRVKRRYGSCDSDGVIRIRLRNQRNGEFLKYSSLVATLCHELAHLTHLNHGRRFVALYTRVLEFAREQGIYRPGSVTLRGMTGGRHDAPMSPPSRTGQVRKNRPPGPR